MKVLLKVSLIFLLFFAVNTINSQEKAEILKYPKEWRLEKVKFPLDFAKDITWKGFEELRFSPGMFDRSSENYFTYYFAVQIEDAIEVTEKEVQVFLNTYYRGLCKAVNSKEKFNIDYKKIQATTTKLEDCLLAGSINFYDSFTNGKETVLKMLITFKKNTENKVILLVSVVPEGKVSKLKGLHEKNIQNNLPK